MKSSSVQKSFLLVLMTAACGDTIALGGPPDGQAASSATTGVTTSGSGSGTTQGSGGSGGTSGSGGTGGTGGGTVCGGLIGLTCPADSFCDFDTNAQCGIADQTGICRPRPEACLADCPGVCGCDGKFYCNACNAHGAGVDDTSDRTCVPSMDAGSRVCGGIAGFKCQVDSYCDFEPNTCGSADRTGVCQRRPTVCTADCPGVCGCDGKFYCNACGAAAAGIDVSSDTSCLRRDSGRD